MRFSVGPSLRRMIIEMAANTAATAAVRWPRCNSWKPGRTTSSTPRNPVATASQRRQPTRSPSSGIDSIVAKSGIRNSTA